MTLHTEIFEQPACLERLLTSQIDNVQEIASAIQSRDIQYAFLAARGTSDNAGRYANYLWGVMNSLPMALATPSLFTYYRQPPRLNNALVVGISQSGQSPDIVSVVEEGKRQGNLTLAITNAVNSPLAKAADFVLDISAGEEKAVAATKTYTTQLMSIAMLAAALKADESCWDELAKVSGWVTEALQLDRLIGQEAQRYRYVNRTIVLGRGYNYSTAFEWALKLKELTYITAEPYSSADFSHGPIAMVEHGFPVMAIAARGKVFNSMLKMLKRLHEGIAAELVVISNDAEALDLAQLPLAIPSDIPEWLSPLVSIVPAQLFAYHLTLAKGFDTNQPRSINKITETH